MSLICNKKIEHGSFKSTSVQCIVVSKALRSTCDGLRRSEVLGLGDRDVAQCCFGGSSSARKRSLATTSPGLTLVRWCRADPTRDAAPAAARRCRLGRDVCEGRRGSGCGVVPRLARPAPGRWLRILPRVGHDLLNHGPLEDGRNDLEFPGAPEWVPDRWGLHRTARPGTDVEKLTLNNRTGDLTAKNSMPVANRRGLRAGSAKAGTAQASKSTAEKRSAFAGARTRRLQAPRG